MSTLKYTINIDPNITNCSDNLEEYSRLGVVICATRKILQQQLSQDELITYAEVLPNLLEDELQSLIDYPQASNLQIYREQRLQDVEYYFYQQHDCLSKALEYLINLGQQITELMATKQYQEKVLSLTDTYQRLEDELVTKLCELELNFIRLIYLKESVTISDCHNINKLLGRVRGEVLPTDIEKFKLHLEQTFKERICHIRIAKEHGLGENEINLTVDRIILNNCLHKLFKLNNECDIAILQTEDYQQQLKKQVMSLPESLMVVENSLEGIEDLLANYFTLMTQLKSYKKLLPVKNAYIGMEALEGELGLRIVYAYTLAEKMAEKLIKYHKQCLMLESEYKAKRDDILDAGKVVNGSLLDSLCDDEVANAESESDELAVFYAIVQNLYLLLQTEDRYAKHYQHFLKKFTEENQQYLQNHQDKIEELQELVVQSGENSVYLNSVVIDIIEVSKHRAELSTSLDHFVNSQEHSFNQNQYDIKQCRQTLTEIAQQQPMSKHLLASVAHWQVDEQQRKQVNNVNLTKLFVNKLLQVPNVIKLDSNILGESNVDELHHFLETMIDELNNEVSYHEYLQTMLHDKTKLFCQLLAKSNQFIDNEKKSKQINANWLKNIADLIKCRMTRINKIKAHIDNRAQVLIKVKKGFETNKRYLNDLLVKHAAQVLPPGESASFEDKPAPRSLAVKQAEALLQRYSLLQQAQLICDKMMKSAKPDSQKIDEATIEIYTLVKAARAEQEMEMVNDVYHAYLGQWQVLNNKQANVDDYFDTDDGITRQQELTRTLDKLRQSLKQFSDTRFDCLSRRLLLLNLTEHFKQTVLAQETAKQSDYYKELLTIETAMNKALNDDYHYYRNQVGYLITKRGQCQASLPKRWYQYLFMHKRLQYYGELTRQFLAKAEFISNYLYLDYRQSVDNKALLKQLDQHYAVNINSLMVAYIAAKHRLQQVVAHHNQQGTHHLLHYFSQKAKAKRQAIKTAEQNIKQLEQQILNLLDNFASNMNQWCEQLSQHDRDVKAKIHQNNKRLRIVGKSNSE